jgi:cytochrome c biogenesis protein CcmG, thiol:disulfide interchange protein DsbE
MRHHARRHVGLLLAAALGLTGCGADHTGVAHTTAPKAAGTTQATQQAVPASVPACPRPGSDAVSGQTTALGSGQLPCLRAGTAFPLERIGGRRPVLVNLWASWCQPCQREMPRLQKAALAAGGQVLFLGVDTLDSASAARSFLAVMHVSFPQLVDTGGRVRAHVGAVGLPATVVIAADGHVAYRRIGELHPSELTAALASVGIGLRASTASPPL